MKKLLLLFFYLGLTISYGQDADLMLSKDYEDFIDRMVISGKDQSNFHLVMKPYNRTFVDSLLQSLNPQELNNVELTRYNELINILGIKEEIVNDYDTEQKSNYEPDQDTSLFKTYRKNDPVTYEEDYNKSFLGVFYKNLGHFYEHRSKNLVLTLDPILNLQGGISPPLHICF